MYLPQLRATALDRLHPTDKDLGVLLVEAHVAQHPLVIARGQKTQILTRE